MRARCETLHAAAEIGEPVVAYSGLAARALGDDPVASILLCQFWFYTAGGERPTDVTAATLYRVTGINPCRQRRARTELRARGWVSEERQGRRRVLYRLHRDRVLEDLREARLSAETDHKPRAVESGNRSQVTAETDHKPAVVEDGNRSLEPAVESGNRSQVTMVESGNRSLRDPTTIVVVDPIDLQGTIVAADQDQTPQPKQALVPMVAPGGAAAPTGAALCTQPPTKRKGRREPRVYRVELSQESPALARQAAQGALDGVAWGRERERVMAALVTAQALLWHHPFGSYEVEDCQHVAAMLAAGTRVSEIVAALVGAHRKPYWRERCPKLRDIRRNLAEFVAAGVDPARPRKVDKGEAIAEWRAAYATLPLGLRLDVAEEPDFDRKTAEQILLEARGLRDKSTGGKALVRT